MTKLLAWVTRKVSASPELVALGEKKVLNQAKDHARQWYFNECDK